MISQTAEYALRAMVQLGSYAASENGAADAPLTTQQIAAATRVPVSYLSKVLQGLSRAGLISSQRGLGGGFRLTRPAQQISVYEVVQAVDPVLRIHACPLGLEAHAERLCPLHKRLDDIAASVESAFGQTSIAELIETPSPFCTAP